MFKSLFQSKAKTSTYKPKVKGRGVPLKTLGSEEFSPIFEEVFSELRPPSGLSKFKNMEDNEPIIGGLMTRFANVFKSARYTIDGPNAHFVKQQLDNLPYGLIELIENFTSAFVFGFSLNEKIWASEGSQIVLIDLEPRYQLTIDEFVSEKGHTSYNQRYAKQTTNEMGTVYIPLTKCVHFMPRTRCRNPYGRSLLRSVYKPYYYKSSIEASEAQSIDRALSGLPVMTAPEGFDFVNADPDSPGYNADVAATLDWAEDVVSKVRKDEMQGIVKPFGWELNLLKGENTVAVNTPDIISRYNVEMAVGLLQTFAVMGGFASTNNSNIEEMIRDFRDSCNSYLYMMAEVINKQIIRDICDFNFKKSYPTIKFHSVASEELEKLASFVARLVAQNVITPTDTFEKAMVEKIDVEYTTKDRKVIPAKTHT